MHSSAAIAYLRRSTVLGVSLVLACAVAAGVAAVALVVESSQEDVYQQTLSFPIKVSRPDASTPATVVEALGGLCAPCEAELVEGRFVVSGPRSDLNLGESISTLVEHGYEVESYGVESGPSLDLMLERARSRKALAYYLMPLPLMLFALAIVSRSRAPEIRGQYEQPENGPVWKLVLLGIVGGFVFAGISALLAGVAGWLGYPVMEQPWLQTLVSQGGASNSLLLCSVVILAPVGEEWFFRGWVFPYFGQLSVTAGYLISAVVFATIHLHPPALLIYFFLGLGLAWLYRVTGSLVAPVCAHAVNNALALALLA